MEYQRASAATAFSKKLSNGHSFNGKNMYDGVFGGQSKVGSRVEDYEEIFGGGSGSSIPVLDVPELNERKFSVDVSSSKLDYSNIFASFGDFDFAVSHDEFIAKPARDKKTPTETRSDSEGSFSYPSTIPVGNQVLSGDQTSHESGNGVKQFKMSINKSSPGSKNGTNGTTHVAQLHAVPGYICLVDERITPSDKPVPSVVNEPCQTNNFGERVMEGLQCKKPVSNVPPSGVNKQTSKGVNELHSESRSNGYDFNDVLFGSYDVGRRTPPSKVTRASSMLNNMGGNKRDSLKFWVSRSHSLDDDAGVSTPPYFDDEVDANSVAATSAAAVKKAIEEAKARLKIAKEMMERRKGHMGHGKPSFNGSLKAKERTMGKDTVKQNNFSQDKAQETCEKILSVQTSAGVGKQNVMKVCQVAVESEEREKSFIAREAAGGTYAKNFMSSQADCWQEVEKMEAVKEGERENDAMQALNNYEGEEMKIIEKPEKYGEKSKHVEDAREYERKPDASKELCRKEECLHKLKPDVESDDRKEETELRFSEHWEETEENCERKLKDPEKPTEDERKIEMQELKDTDNLERPAVAQEWVDMEEKYKHMLKQEENGSALRDVFEKEENEMLLQDVSIRKEFEKIYEEAFEILELKSEQSEQREHKEARGPEENNEEEEEDACNREDNEQISDKMENPEIIDLRHIDFDYDEERKRRLEENSDSLGNEVFMEAEENEELFKDAYRMGNEEFMEAEENADLFKDAYEIEAVEEGQKEAPERLGTEEMQKQSDKKADEMTEAREDAIECCQEDLEAANDEYNDNEINNLCETLEPSINEDGSEKEAPERLGTEEMQKQTDQKADEMTEAIEEAIECCHEDLEAANDEYDDNESNNLCETLEPSINEDSSEKEAPERLGTEEMQKQTDQKADEMTEAREDVIECCQEDHEAANDEYDDNEINNLGEILEPSINEDSSEMTAELLVNEENGGTAEGSKAYSECKETRRDSEAVEVDNDLEESLAFDKADLTESNLKLNEIEQQKENTKEAFDFYRCGIDFDTADVTFEQNQYEQHSRECEIIWAMEKNVEELACESEEDDREAEFGLKQEENKEAEFGLKQEENKYNFEFSDEGRLVDSQLHCKFGEKLETTHVAYDTETSQSAEYNESHHETLMKEERETKISCQGEVKLVKEQQRRVDETKERERERVKERIAVERAIREARERAFAEARERAVTGRTNVEARGKVGREAQGESTKPSAGANDKTIMEAKLKAERAAVERATAEARQRALEKALSEKASFGARKQAEKFSDAKQSFQSNDSHYKGSCPATGKYPDSTNQSGSNSSEGLDRATGELTQRCKVDLEKHQRTAERAAKALAEKNKRDILAQKEQAERNRLAETLDAEVKRWSSGKQGNIRALLSTLQYILGPDSGWQPIPLTDMIATAAVKKAYRKATLCVHPDKLQQRGASIQQKHTCEKVFDLLKDAWNKFSAEER